MHGLQMCVRKISGFVLMWGLTCSSLLRSQIFYVYRPRPPAFRYVPIVRGSGVSEQGVPLFGGLSLRLGCRCRCPLRHFLRPGLFKCAMKAADLAVRRPPRPPRPRFILALFRTIFTLAALAICQSTSPSSLSPSQTRTSACSHRINAFD